MTSGNSMNFWKETKDELPADDILIFIVDTKMPHYNYRIGYLKQGKWYTHFNSPVISEITHWACIQSNYSIPKKKATYWCTCDWPNIRMKDRVVICVDCEGVIECELCDSKQIATIIHIDYTVYKKHEWNAIDNVASRRW